MMYYLGQGVPKDYKEAVPGAMVVEALVGLLLDYVLLMKFG